MVEMDGAKDYCHVAEGFRNECCDLYLAGTHKWLGAHHPMGVAFYGRCRSQGFIETVHARMAVSGDLDDPLLCFTSRLASGKLDGLSETVNLAPLFSSQGATVDARNCYRSAGIENASATACLAYGSGWKPLLPTPDFRSGILILRSENAAVTDTDAASLREAFYAHGVALTAYERGVIRLSMPQTALQGSELKILRQALLTSA